jgi:type IV pilus assembly protein PilV
MKQLNILKRSTALSFKSTREHGFSLLEVMIALIVLSIGLLGIAGLQTFSLQFNHQSYERTQATVLISEIFDRIMANPTAARAGQYDNVADSTTSASYTGYGNCGSTGCASTNELATYDLFIWKTAIENSKMSQGQGAIRRVNPGDANSFVYVITISWVENNLPVSQSMTVRTL